MKKIITLTLLFFTCQFTNACDICGCGVGSGYIGILPDFNKKIIGIRYRYSSIQTHVGIGGSSSYLTTREHYQVAELWSAVNISRKFRLMATLPYNFTEKKNNANHISINGLGDASLHSFYNLLNSKRAVGKNKLLVQSLWIGPGIKLPTGSYQPSNKQNSNDANIFQLGTGSIDFSMNAMYDIRLQDIGFNINGSYKINTKNKYGYTYGNKLSFNTQLYHKFRISNYCSIAPNAGISYEKAAKDKENIYVMDVSGGNITMGLIGTEISYKKMVAGFNLQQPLQQTLANGLVKAGNKAMLHIAFAF